MKVFISGVAGLLGSHLADAMLAEGHHVVGCDCLIGGELDNVPHDVEFYRYDCRCWNSMVRIMRGCELVFHCAATPYEGLSVVSPHVVTQNIVGASVSVFSAAIESGVKRIVACSSMSRYGAGTVPFVETQPPQPQDPYGIGKVCAEDILRNLCTVHGVQYAIAVPHNIIGSRQKYDDPYRNVASIMINLMLQGRQPIIYGDGEQKRCFSFIQDCVFCLREMAFRDNTAGEIINIGPDEEFVTINQLAATIAGLLDFDLDPIYMPDRPQEVKYATCSADKARKMLGYETKTSLQDGLGEMIAFIRRKGPRKFRYHLDLEIVNAVTPRTWKEHLF
jgi:UDP-glucose 4-epimerase